MATTVSPATTQVETGPQSLEKAAQLMTEFGLPNGLLPLQEVVECGYNRATGYVWITQKKAIVHKFEAISKQVSYGQKITAFLEKGRLKKLTGVKAKELLLWVSIVDIAATAEENEKRKVNLVHPKTTHRARSIVVVIIILKLFSYACLHIKEDSDAPENEISWILYTTVTRILCNLHENYLCRGGVFLLALNYCIFSCSHIKRGF